MSTKEPNPVDRYVGSRVRMRRIMLGMSQEKLGEALGLTFQQVQKYEKGTNRVSASRLFHVAQVLGVPVQYFYEDLLAGAEDSGQDGFGESSDDPPGPVPTTTASGGGASEPAVTQPRRSDSSTPTAPGSATESGGGTQTAPPAGRTTTSSSDEFTPARVFVWLARDGATVYDVTFLRNGNAFYSARVSRPRLTLPERIRFTPGSYRWIVRPGAPGEALGRPIVDSTFTIEPS